MFDPEEITSQQELLMIHRRTLAHLLQQVVNYGGDSIANPQTIYDIVDTRAQIQHIKDALRANGVNIEDHPYDKPVEMSGERTTIDIKPNIVAGDIIQGDKVVGDKILGDKIVIQGGNVSIETRASNLLQSTLSVQERRNRSWMLRKVHNFWIEGVLDDSLYGTAIIDLEMEYKYDAVIHPWDVDIQNKNRFVQRSRVDVKILQLFNDFNGEMLILGGYGSGKTTVLLSLARELITYAEKDEIQPIPVVLNLVTWAEKQKPIVEWVINELNIHYDLPRQIARNWINTNHILLLLDALDELIQDQRAACVEAINAFRLEYGLIKIVVCSRANEYEVIKSKLKLQGAILLTHLRRHQIDTHLINLGEKGAVLGTAIYYSHILRDLADTPLMLNVMLLAFDNIPAEFPIFQQRIEEWRDYIFALYIYNMLKKPRYKSSYSPQQITRWLIWIARGMSLHTQSIFYLEYLQPSWLTNLQLQKYRLYYNIFSGLILGIVTGIGIWLGFGLIFGFQVGYDVGVIVGISIFATGICNGLIEITNGIVRNILIGLSAGLILGYIANSIFDPSTGLIVGIAAGVLWFITSVIIKRSDYLVDSQNNDLEQIIIVENLRWSGSIVPSIHYSLVIGLVFGSIIWLVAGPITGLIVGMGILSVGLIIGFTHALRGSEREVRITPNQGIWRSAYYALLGGLTFGLLFGLSIGLLVAYVFGWNIGLGSGLSTGFVGGLIGGSFKYGGRTCIQHLSLRFIMICGDTSPWRYTRFLDHCVRLTFLRKVGGGYIFNHRSLLEYFTSLDIQHRNKYE